MVIAKLLAKEHCRDIAQRLEDGIARYDFRINRDSDVGSFIRELRWFAERVEEPENVVNANDRRRCANAILIADQAENIAATFTMLRETDVPHEKLKFINSRLNRLKKVGDAKARDILFEFEVAGRVARWRQLRVSFEEPDVIIKMEGGCIGLACKRLTSLNQISKRIRKAADQGALSAFPFFIILGVDHLITKDRFLLVQSEDELAWECNQRLDQLLLKCSDAAIRAFEKRAGGLILCGRVVGIIEPAPGGLGSVQWRVRHKIIPNFEIPDAATTLRYLVDLMERNED